jgi:hypothetical protein
MPYFVSRSPTRSIKLNQALARTARHHGRELDERGNGSGRFVRGLHMLLERAVVDSQRAGGAIQPVLPHQRDCRRPDGLRNR